MRMHVECSIVQYSEKHVENESYRVDIHVGCTHENAFTFPVFMACYKLYTCIY